MKNILLSACLSVVLGACSNSSQMLESPAVSSSNTKTFQKSIDYIPTALGSLSWKITSGSEKAQQYFKQGLQLRYAFIMNDAARSFREARLADPQCAMCYWGEALALGSFLNGGMTKEKAPYAHAAIENAVALISTYPGSANALERDLIMTARDRYPADYEPVERQSTDRAFADRMKAVYEKYPQHQDVAVIYAMALFLLEDRRGYRDVNDPNIVSLYGVLNGVLEKNIKHPGACHLFIHATESSQQPELALECADFISAAIPVASHIQHMPSHTWNQLGLWERSVNANKRAVISDRKAAANKGFSYGATHNLHMLLFAGAMDGQSEVALQAARSLTELSGNNTQEMLTLLRFGRFDELEQISNRPEAEVAGGFWDFSRGYAALKNGNPEGAYTYLNNIQEIATHSTARYRFHKASQLMGLAAAILKGEILRVEGDIEAALSSFRLAAQLDDSQQYDEPEPIPFAARHWLGAALMEAGRYAEAEREYRIELADHPHNVWSLTGLQAAIAAQGKMDAAVAEDFNASTARMDMRINSSRF